MNSAIKNTLLILLALGSLGLGFFMFSRVMSMGGPPQAVLTFLACLLPLALGATILGVMFLDPIASFFGSFYMPGGGASIVRDYSDIRARIASHHYEEALTMIDKELVKADDKLRLRHMKIEVLHFYLDRNDDALDIAKRCIGEKSWGEYMEEITMTAVDILIEQRDPMQAEAILNLALEFAPDESASRLAMRRDTLSNLSI